MRKKICLQSNFVSFNKMGRKTEMTELFSLKCAKPSKISLYMPNAVGGHRKKKTSHTD